jgi:hypothetical protein
VTAATAHTKGDGALGAHRNVDAAAGSKIESAIVSALETAAAPDAEG